MFSSDVRSPIYATVVTQVKGIECGGSHRIRATAVACNKIPIWPAHVVWITLDLVRYMRIMMEDSSRGKQAGA